MTLEAFLDMGGYAGYVWSSYAIALLVVLFNLIAPLRRHRRLIGECMRRRRSVEPAP